MEKILIKGILVLLLNVLTTIHCSGIEEQKRQGHSNCKTEINESTRGSPADTCQYSIQVKGKSNVVKVNNKIMKSTPDTTQKQNNLSVAGEGNRISIIQTDNQSQVSIAQKGKNNRISITQK